MVLLALENYAACSSLNVYSARKSAVLVLELFYKIKGDREQDL
jgi:hypothetical protein